MSLSSSEPAQEARGRFGRTVDTYPCGSKRLDETVEVQERTGLQVMNVMQIVA